MRDERTPGGRAPTRMRPGLMSLHVTSVVALVTALAARPARAEPVPGLAVVFHDSAAQLPAKAIRKAIAAELGTELVDDLAHADGVLAVAIGPTGRLVLTYRLFKDKTSRAVPAPEAAGDTPTVLALLAANLVRNEALELLTPFPDAPARPLARPSELVSPFDPAQPASPPPNTPRAPATATATATTTATATLDAGAVAAPSSRGPVYLMMGLGTGGGWSRGPVEMNPQYLDGTAARTLQASGPGWVGGYHLAAEVGWLVRPKLLIGGQLRLQHVLGATEVRHASCGDDATCDPPSAATALLARAGWLSPLGPHVRWLAAGAIGVGRVRHLVNLEHDARIQQTCGPTGSKGCVDTVASGLLLLGPSLALFYDLGAHLSAFVSLQLLVGVPRAMTNLDGAAGLAVRL